MNELNNQKSIVETEDIHGEYPLGDALELIQQWSNHFHLAMSYEEMNA